MEQESLFTPMEKENEPLASRLRPATLDGFVGQQHLLGERGVLRQMIEHDRVPSMIFWGPPGVGKTTLARIIANRTRAAFVNFSAVTSGIKEIKEVMADAERGRLAGQKTIVFVDEIHRFNKAQQDAFLPYVEKGSITLIGATTENPSFEVNSALLSRCKVFVLKALTTEEVAGLLRHALSAPEGLGNQRIALSDAHIHLVAEFSNGDARIALNTLEMVVLNGELSRDGTITVTDAVVEQCLGKKALLFDKQGEEHYNTISAIHKSLRNSDVDAALYWTARMLEAGEDPLYIARRLIRFASEDIGMADSRALEITVAAYQACHFLGMPECNVHLAHAVIYLALAPKSRAVDSAYAAAAKDARDSLAEPVPLCIRNAPTGLMKDLGYGEGYQFDPGTALNLTTMQCLPDSLAGRHYYDPSPFGAEKRCRDTLEEIAAWKEAHKQGEAP